MSRAPKMLKANRCIKNVKKMSREFLHPGLRKWDGEKMSKGRTSVFEML